MDLNDYYDAHLEHYLYRDKQWGRVLPLLRRLFDVALVEVLTSYDSILTCFSYRNAYVTADDDPDKISVGF